MSTLVSLPVDRAADIIERVVESHPDMVARRTPRVGGAIEIRVTKMTHGRGKGCLALLFLPIGLLLFLTQKKSPQELGELLLTPISTDATNLTGSIGPSQLSGAIMTALGIRLDELGQAPVMSASTYEQPPPPPPSADVLPGKADWYPDPRGETRLRYFDGSKWTDHTAD